MKKIQNRGRLSCSDLIMLTAITTLAVAFSGCRNESFPDSKVRNEFDTFIDSSSASLPPCRFWSVFSSFSADGESKSIQIRRTTIEANNVYQEMYGVLPNEDNRVLLTQSRPLNQDEQNKFFDASNLKAHGISNDDYSAMLFKLPPNESFSLQQVEPNEKQAFNEVSFLPMVPSRELPIPYRMMPQSNEVRFLDFSDGENGEKTLVCRPTEGEDPKEHRVTFDNQGIVRRCVKDMDDGFIESTTIEYDNAEILSPNKILSTVYAGSRQADSDEWYSKSVIRYYDFESNPRINQESFRLTSFGFPEPPKSEKLPWYSSNVFFGICIMLMGAISFVVVKKFWQ